MQNIFISNLDEERQYSASEVIPNARWEIVEPRPKRPAVLRVNWQAAAILDPVMNCGSVFYGTVLIPQRFTYLPSSLREYAFTFSDNSHREMIRKLALAIEKLNSVSTDGHAVVQRVDRVERLKDIRRLAIVLREELTHWKQKHFDHLHPRGHVIIADVTNHPYWDRIGLALSSEYDGDVSQLVLEAGAKLAADAGPELGLSEEEGNEFFRHYRLQIARLHGQTVADQILQFADRRRVS